MAASKGMFAAVPASRVRSRPKRFLDGDVPVTVTKRAKSVQLVGELPAFNK